MRRVYEPRTRTLLMTMREGTGAHYPVRLSFPRHAVLVGEDLRMYSLMMVDEHGRDWSPPLLNSVALGLICWGDVRERTEEAFWSSTFTDPRGLLGHPRSPRRFAWAFERWLAGDLDAAFFRLASGPRS